MTTDAVLNQRNRRKIRETARRRVVEYAPYIMRMSRTPTQQRTISETEGALVLCN